MDDFFVFYKKYATPFNTQSSRVLKTLFLFIFLILHSSNLFGQAYTAKFYNQGQLRDLPKLKDLTKDDKGYLWMATSEGIFKFDGKSNVKIKEGNYDNIYILNGHNVYAAKNEKLIKVYVDPNLTGTTDLNDDFPEGQIIHDVLNMDDHTDWALGNDLIRVDSGGVFSFKIPQLQDEELFLAALDQMPLLVTSSGNTFLFNMETENLQSFASLPKEYGRIKEVSTFPGGQGLIMAAASGLVYLRYNNSRSEFVSMTIAENVEKYVVAGLNVFYQSPEEALMMASYSNRGFLKKKVYNFEGFHSLKELAFKEVSCLYYDPVLRSVWLYTDQGLLNLFPLKFERVNDNITTYEITSITHLKNGLGFCVAGGNIFKSAFTSDDYSTERIDFTEVDGNAFAVAGAGSKLWFSTLSNFLYTWEDGKTEQAVDLNYRGGIIYYLFGDSREELWVSQAPSDNPIVGVLKISRTGDLVEYDQDDGLETRILVTKESSDGTIYCAGGGTTTYLYRLNNDDQKFTNISAPLNFNAGESFEVHDLAVQADSIIWLATTSGLVKYSPDGAKKVQFPELPKNEAIAIRITDEGILWVSTDTKGIVRYNTRTGDYILYDINSGLPSNLMYYRSMSLEPNGKVWVGTSEGVVMNTPGEPIKVSTPMITSIMLNGKTTDLSVLSENLPFESDVEIKFQSLTYPREGVNYSYLIDGGISSWVELGTQDSLYLQDLDRGDYSIKLKAEHINGLRESEWLNIEFSVNEVWYKTTWALFSFLGTGVLLALAGSRVYSRNLRKEKQVLEQEKRHLQEKLDQGMKLIEEKEKALAVKEKEQYEQNWMNEALVEFSKLLGEHKDDIKAMNDVVLSKLAQKMGTRAGLIFLKENIEIESPLKVSSAYGVGDIKGISDLTFDIGQGMAGVALAEGETKVYRRDLPDNFFKISSSLGEAKPRELALVPIVFEDMNIGILELASFGAFEDHHLEFLERLTEMLASKIMTLALIQKNTL